MVDGREDVKVSVVMAVRDGASYLRESVESILCQSFSNFEFIIIDDCSCDDTPEILDSYVDLRIIRMRNGENIGLTRSLNNGAKVARGEYVARMDADDIAHLDRFLIQVAYLDENPNVGVCGSSAVYIDEEGRFLKRVIPAGNRSEVLWNCFFINPFHHSSVMIRKSAFDKVSGYSELLCVAQDYDLFSRILMHFDGVNIQDVLLLYRVHQRSVSHKRRIEQLSVSDKVAVNMISKLLGLCISESDVGGVRETLYGHAVCDAASYDSVRNLKTFLRILGRYVEIVPVGEVGGVVSRVLAQAVRAWTRHGFALSWLPHLLGLIQLHPRAMLVFPRWLCHVRRSYAQPIPLPDSVPAAVEWSFVSMVQCSLGRVDDLERFLLSLKRQTYRRFELVLVDQNSDDRLVPLVEKYGHSFLIRHMRSERGLSKGRNIGLAKAQGDIVMFPDDDCWLPTDCLARVVREFQRRPWAGAVVGRMEDGHGGALGRSSKIPQDINRYTVFRDVSSITMFVRRSVITAVGGMDENLGLGCASGWLGAEDYDYMIRVIDSGFNVPLVPSILIFHPRKEDNLETATGRVRLAVHAHSGVMRKHSFPLWFFVYMMARQGAAACLAVCKLDIGKARYRLAVVQALWRGWRSWPAGSSTPP